MTERYHQRLGVRFLASNQVEPELISQRRQRAHVTGVQQDPEQMFDGQVVSVVIRVRALEQADVGNTHLGAQRLSFVVLDRVVAGPQELVHS
ncbi:hypothetical protein D3C76_1426120 [compost metagenome]